MTYVGITSYDDDDDDTHEKNNLILYQLISNVCVCVYHCKFCVLTFKYKQSCFKTILEFFFIEKDWQIYLLLWASHEMALFELVCMCLWYLFTRMYRQTHAHTDRENWNWKNNSIELKRLYFVKTACLCILRACLL